MLKLSKYLIFRSQESLTGPDSAFPWACSTNSVWYSVPATLMVSFLLTVDIAKRNNDASWECCGLACSLQYKLEVEKSFAAGWSCKNAYYPDPWAGYMKLKIPFKEYNCTLCFMPGNVKFLLNFAGRLMYELKVQSRKGTRFCGNVEGRVIVNTIHKWNS